MTTQPPRFAMWLLGRFGPEDEPLSGDLIEEFQVRRSRWWLWRQILTAILIASFRKPGEIRPLRLIDDPGLRAVTSRLSAPRTVNLSASPVPGIGGLGLLALVMLVTIVAPQAWWILLVPVLGGILLGVTWIVRGRHDRRAG
jgi:hypothetical protein